MKVGDLVRARGYSGEQMVPTARAPSGYGLVTEVIMSRHSNGNIIYVSWNGGTPKPVNIRLIEVITCQK